MAIHFRSIDGTDISLRDYDDRAALEDYFYRHAKHFMTDFEKRCIRLGIAREYAVRIDGPSVPRGIWERESDPDVEKALNVGLWEYQVEIRKRLLSMYDQGELKANRCPLCKRVARTPLAKQCRWCKHDWHAT